MRLQPLGDGFDPALELPLKGGDGVTRVYRVEPPSGELGWWVQQTAQLVAQLRSLPADSPEAEAITARLRGSPRPRDVDEDDARSPNELLLGVALDAMVADGVPWPAVQHAAATAGVWISAGDAAAEEFWTAAGIRPEAPGPANRADRRALTRTVAADTTRRPDSTSGTRSPRRSGRAGRGSRGARS